ncbi:MAG: PAS domain S-box protein [Acidobacteria bacterium]|nr:PAS domain S-box protein [Acidobacteriota bacterium]
MIWLIAGVAYMATCALVAWLVADAPLARLWIGNIGLLLPPLAPIAIVFSRRRSWVGHHRVFWDAIAAAAALWLASQILYAVHELRLQQPMPWVDLIVVPQLCASLMPLLALVARPHRGQRPETALTAVVDLYVLGALAGFLYWSLIILPGLAPTHSEMAVRVLTVVGPAVRAAVVGGLVLAMRAAGRGPWAAAYQRIAAGALASFVILAALPSIVVEGSYRTGSPIDVGWMVQFLFWAWAAATMPASEPEPRRSIVDTSRPSPPTLLFAALCAVPLIGFGGRYLLPLPEPFERYREVATITTLVFGLVMAMVRNGVERRALRYAERQIRLLAAACEQSDELILIIRTGAIRYANHAFCRVSGYTAGELEALAPQRLGPAGSRDIVSRLGHAESSRETTRVTSTICRKDGTSFQADCTIAPIVDPVHEGVHLVCVMRDLTDELRVQEQLVRTERLSAIGELLSGVAHELSNPLQSVVGSLQLMRHTDDAIRQQRDLERASREAERAVHIVKNLLAFVKRSPSERILTDFTELVRSSVAMRLPALRASSIELCEDHAEGLPLVLINRDEIQQAIVNLIVNAEQSMSAARGRGILSIRTFLSGTDAVLEVSDDGPGVAADVAGRIFEPFFRARNQGAGSGLGLSAAFGIVAAHGGTLELVTTLHGACFRLALPGAGFPGPGHIQYN